MLAPYSQACENNKTFILPKLQRCFANKRHVLEIGSGTAQHAVFFSQHLPHVRWQCTDQAHYLDGIKAQIAATKSPLPAPLALDVTQPWPTMTPSIDAAFTANTLHIMDEPMVQALWQGLGSTMDNAADVVIYGPFRYHGRYTSQSNSEFDLWLKQRDSRSSIKEIDWVRALAQTEGFELVSDEVMPANNQLLHFRR